MKRLLVLQHLEMEGPGLFQQIAKERKMNVINFRLDLGDNLPQTKNGDLLLIMGGPMGIKDIGSEKYPWLRMERDYIKEELNKMTPIIGVCLGAQLLSNAAGGDVEILKEVSSSKALPEIGWSQIYLNKSNNDLSKFFKEPFHVLHWHADRILLPKHALLIASSNRCKEQFFKIGKFAYGLQFHIESKKEMTEKWINEDKKFICKGLGHNGQSILRSEDKKFGEATYLKRKLLINKLFDMLSSQ